MIKWIKGFFAQPSLDSFDGPIPRERLIQTARIVMVDDEDSLLVDELKSAGFSIEHDRAGNDLRAIDSQLYDLAILDYHGVGGRLGTAQGLDLLKHIRRVSPRTRVLAYTSRSLSATESEFFRLSHGVLPKDLGLVDSMAVIEGELQKAMGKEHLLDALLTKLNVSDPEKKRDARDALATALRGKNESQFKDYVTKLGGKIGEKAVDVIISKLFGL